MKYLSIIPLLILCSFISYAQTLPPPFTACPSTGFQVVNNPMNFQTVPYKLAGQIFWKVLNFPKGKKQ